MWHAFQQPYCNAIPGLQRTYAAAALVMSLWALSGNTSAAQLQITQLEDIEWRSVPTNASGVGQEMSFCVSMDPAGPYQLSAAGTVSGRRFALLDDTGELGRIRLRVRVAGPGQRRGRTLQPGRPVTALQARPPRPNGGCRGGLTTLSVTLNERDLRAAPSGAYRGRLVLTVAPE